MKAAQAPSATALRSALLDPAVNILIQKLRQELITTKAKLEDTQSELSAWKFTPDRYTLFFFSRQMSESVFHFKNKINIDLILFNFSNTGKRLMAKCRLLYQENEELGRMIASGRIAKLEGELALQKVYSEEVKKSQTGEKIIFFFKSIKFEKIVAPNFSNHSKIINILYLKL